MNKTSKAIRAALKHYYPSQEYAIAFEVAQATGYRANRHLDAVVMSLWPSRGLTLTGIEIKVNLQDWRREKANPQKAEEIAQFLDFFYIAAPDSLIKKDELPEAWGLIEVNDKGLCRQTKAAVKTSAIDGGRPFMAALMRAMSRGYDPESLDAMLEQRRRDLESNFDQRVMERAQMLSTNNTRAAKHWAELIEAIGYDPQRFWESEGIIEAIRLVYNAKIADPYGGVKGMLTVIDSCRERIVKALDEFKPRDRQ